MLALESSDSSISLLDRRGKPVSQSVLRAEGTAALACLEWHPQRQILSAAWSSGEVRLWHVLRSGSVTTKTLSGTLEEKPALLAWSPTGSYLILGYSSGRLRIWKQPPQTDDDPLPWAQVLFSHCNPPHSLRHPSKSEFNHILLPKQ